MTKAQLLKLLQKVQGGLDPETAVEQLCELSIKEQAITDYRRLTAELQNCGCDCADLNVGDTVVLRDGSSQTITTVKWGEATGKQAFYRWRSNFPYEIDHAAMDSRYEIVDVILA